jgi:hypothetical protein
VFVWLVLLKAVAIMPLEEATLVAAHNKTAIYFSLDIYESVLFGAILFAFRRG